MKHDSWDPKVIDGTATDNAGTWRPHADDVAGAQVTALARALGVGGFDELLSTSLEHPGRYWRTVLDHLGIVWMRDPDAYVDLARGPELPSWFPGGELNWVASVLRFAEDDRTRDKAAVVAESENGAARSATYCELDEQVRTLAGGLLEAGLVRGDRVGLLMENGIEATVAMLAIAYAGLVAVPLFSGFGAEAVVTRLAACGARGLIASSGFDRRGIRVDLAGTVAEVTREVPSVRVVVTRGDVGGNTLDFDALVRGSARLDVPARMESMDPFMVIFTSGTTGRPKGAVHTHAGFPLKIAHDALVHFDVDEDAVFCWPADMGWIAGSLVLCTALLRGATLVCYDGAPDYPDWSRLSRIVEAHGVTHLGSAPTLIRGLAAHEDIATAGDVSSIRLLITAGEGIDPEHFTWFRTAFGRGRHPLINYTGGTEVSGALLSSVVVRPIAPAAFNTASPAVDVVVVDRSGEPVTDEVGELAVRAPFVGMTAGFWEDEERYLETYWRTVPGIWVHGDLAMHRSSGDYLMLGRSDDTIKVAGKRLGPAEVEEVLLAIDAVSEVATIGVPDPVKGQRVVVFAVMHDGWDGDRDRLAREVRARIDASVGKAFRPSEVHVVTELPKTRSSKVMRRLIRDLYNGSPVGDLTALDNPSALEEIRRVGSGASS